MTQCKKEKVEFDLHTMPDRNRAVRDLSIVIVNWNTRDMLRDCLHSVHASLDDLDVEVMVVDNASSDGSAAMVEEEFPEVRLIANHDNRGFAAANNQGMKPSSGRYVLLLNPDTIVAPVTLNRMIRYADDHTDAAVIGCQVYESEHCIQRTCFRYPDPVNTLFAETGLSRLCSGSRLFGRYWMGDWDRKSEREVDVVSGMFMLVRREAIEQVGFMDESYFIFAEEADWCHRFRRAGWRCIFTPEARIIHRDGGGKSTEQISVRMYVQMQKSLLMFQRKNLGRRAWFTSWLIYVISTSLRTVLWTSLGVLQIGTRSTHRRKQAVAALRFHLTGREPV